MTTSTTSSIQSSARYATPRDPDRPSRGLTVDARFVQLNRALPFPWQRYVNAVAGELNDDGTGFRYPTVVLSVPRRAGKSTDVLATCLDRMETSDRARCWVTMQTGTAATEMFRNEWAPLVDRSATLSTRYRLRRSEGREAIERRRGSSSRTRMFAPEKDALHGQNADLVVVDEAWAIRLDQGEALEAAARPAQLTRPWRQLWIVSAGGTIESVWWDRWLETAAGAASVALFDFGADPTDPGYDPSNPEVWARAHPSAGLGFPLDALAHEWETRRDDAAFERAYLNVWPRPSSIVAASGIDPDVWRAAAVPELAVDVVTAIAVDVAPDRSSAAVAVAGPRPGDPESVVVEVVAHDRGVGWVADRVRQLRRGAPGAAVVADSIVAASIVTDLERARVEVESVGVSAHARACGTFVDRLATGRVSHRGQAALTDAVAGAVRRGLGDGWLWARAKSNVDVSPLVAATLATWAAGRTRPRGRAVVVAASETPPGSPVPNGGTYHPSRGAIGP